MNPIIGLLPELVIKLRDHKAHCQSEEIRYIVTDGYRTFEEQMQKYRQGRESTSGGWVTVDKSKIITMALPDDSPHCRRAAYDIAILRDGKLVWTGIDDLYRKAGWLGEELGLVWGGRFGFGDLDHFELKHWKDLPIA